MLIFFGLKLKDFTIHVPGVTHKVETLLFVVHLLDITFDLLCCAEQIYASKCLGFSQPRLGRAILPSFG